MGYRFGDHVAFARRRDYDFSDMGLTASLPVHCKLVTKESVARCEYLVKRAQPANYFTPTAARLWTGS
jgi:hypothetical protein